MLPDQMLHEFPFLQPSTEIINWTGLSKINAKVLWFMTIQNNKWSLAQ